MRAGSLGLIWGTFYLAFAGFGPEGPAALRGCQTESEPSGRPRPAEPHPTTEPAGDEEPAGGLSLEEDAQNVPGPPGTIHVTHRASLHTVEWEGTRDDTIGGYQVYRRCGGAAWKTVGFVRLREDDPRNRGRYLFEEHHGAACLYTVAAVTPAGEPGPKEAEIHSQVGTEPDSTHGETTEPPR